VRAFRTSALHSRASRRSGQEDGQGTIGRFPTLAAVVDHYDTCFHLNLAAGEKRDLIQYLLSLTF